MASRGVNKVILVGRVGQDPEIRYMPNGGAVANITLATSEEWKDKQTGEKKELTEWHRIVIFGKLAEIAGEYLKKGSQVYFEGQLRTRKWQDTQGTDRWTTEVVIPQMGGVMQMLGGNPNNAGGSQQQGGGNNNGWGQPQQPTHSGPGNNGGQQQQQQQRQPAGGYDRNAPNTQNSAPAGNNPPMDFDDDIPF